MNTLINLCFLCTKDYNCVPVDDKIVSQIEYLLPEITIFKLGIPLRICSVCDGALYAFNKFKQFYVESSRRLEANIKGAQGPPLQADGPPVVIIDILSPVQQNNTIPQNELQTDENNEEIPVPTKKRITKNSQKIQESSSSILKNKLQEKCSSPEPTTDDSSETSIDEPEKIEEIFIKEEPPEEIEMYNMFESTLKEGETDNQTHEENTNTTRTEEIYSEEETTNDKTEQVTHIGIQVFKCDICSKTFTFKSNLVRHKKIHLDKNKFICSICNKVCRNENKLNRHMKLHTGEKEFFCPVCNKAFTCRSNLNTHIKLHSEVKDFQCDICNKSYTQKYNFELHMKTHSGIKDFPCYVCSKAFACRGTLKRHLKIHSGEKDFSCEICGKSFTLNHHLADHMRTHTGIKFLC